MSGKKGKSGGARKFAGRKTNSVPAAEDRRALAVAAAAYTMEALDTMVELMRSAESESVRLMAADRILDRAIGKAPMTVDVTALRHDEIVYKTPQDIVRALIEERGVNPLLIEHMTKLTDVTPSKPSDSDPGTAKH
jgi:hypothetical protein